MYRKDAEARSEPFRSDRGLRGESGKVEKVELVAGCLMLVCPSRKPQRHPEGGTTEESPQYRLAPITKESSVDYSRGFLLLTVVGMTKKKEKAVEITYCRLLPFP